jgi:predicted ABC-type ATPase
MDDRPDVIVLAGPNGAGKSTLATALFGGASPVRHYVNADTIARGLSEFHSEEMACEAGRIMLAHLKALAERKATFAFETTLATRGFAPWLGQLRQSGYFFQLFFLWLPFADMAVQRVRDRVKLGGHSVPEETVRRRYQRGISNFFKLYRPIADEWRVYDNAQPSRPVIIAEGGGTIEQIIVKGSWDEFQRTGRLTDAEHDQRD